MRLRTGRPGRFPSPEEAAEHEFTPQELAILEGRKSSQVIGSPETVRAGLAELLERTGADELMITTAAFSHTDRVRSYALLANVVEMEPRAVDAPAEAAGAPSA